MVIKMANVPFVTYYSVKECYANSLCLREQCVGMYAPGYEWAEGNDGLSEYAGEGSSRHILIQSARAFQIGMFE